MGVLLSSSWWSCAAAGVGGQRQPGGGLHARSRYAKQTVRESNGPSISKVPGHRPLVGAVPAATRWGQPRPDAAHSLARLDATERVTGDRLPGNLLQRPVQTVVPGRIVG